MYESILVEMPGQFDALHMLGVIALQEGRAGDAQLRILHALRSRPDDVPALANLSAAYLRDRKLQEAVHAAERAIALEPESTDALINLGTALHELGRVKEAVAPLESARAIIPGSSIVSNLLGACLMKMGDVDAAVDAFEAGTSAAPTDAEAWSNLAAALNQLSEYDRALACAQKAIELRADSSSALAAQAASLLELGKVDEAIASYREAIKHNPKIEILCNFATALLTSGLNEEASNYLDRAIDMDSNNPNARWIRALATLRPTYDTEQQIEATRHNFLSALDGLHKWFESARPRNAYQSVGASQPFYLAYQEFNNRDLLSRHGDICAQWMSTLSTETFSAGPPLSRSTKMRIGIASGHIRDHSVWIAICKGWLEHLDRKKFEIYLFALTPQSDRLTLEAKQKSDHFDDKVKNIEGWAAAIRRTNLDFLIYPGVGMDSVTYQLASLRLAPLQAASWGHPETTGLRTLDFYLSGDAFEPPDAQLNYSEKLIRLPKFGAYVEPLDPKIREPDLAQMGLPKNEPLLLCPGTPFKYLPTADSVWIEIAQGLQKLGKGRLVFFASSRGAMYIALLTRLRTAFANAGLRFDGRVCVVPVMDRPRFFGLLQKSTLMLDTIGFSGYNTALQGLECGLPVIAYEGKFMRGRLASGILRTMGLHELVATSRQDFIDKAITYASDEKRLKKIRSKIPKLRKSLFRDTSPIRALEAFLESEIQAKRAEASRPA